MDDNKTSDLIDIIETILFIDEKEGIDHRCKHCGFLLFKGNFLGRISVKCRKCKNIVEFENNK
jgi:hypothetical protein